MRGMSLVASVLGMAFCLQVLTWVNFTTSPLPHKTASDQTPTCLVLKCFRLPWLSRMMYSTGTGRGILNPDSYLSSTCSIAQMGFSTSLSHGGGQTLVGQLPILCLSVGAQSSSAPMCGGACL